ncbi:fringe glycosyltransferase-like isoform X2 [Varroa jacobsoni]|uniref:Fringe-like glycosyltransferase domain-containing protein n=1 Tax=Varroa destructor TaxID=109461 RepID=A0A7M7MAS1_VARDE|nr:fringe glycosyltransferase-like isoform X2 [Varroa destructor]XP_022686326.1 fringe glycosyltransferase-like isoform X2 [Varroa jacobsoni]
MYKDRYTYFFSDTDDGEIARASGGHLVVTGCPIGHSRRALSCKMNSEFDVFAASNRSQKKWWCHFDDDNYVNVPALGKVLRRYDSSRVWYLGRNSIMRPIDLNTKDWGSVRFRFATGGAGFCISRALSDALVPYAFAGRLAQLSDRIRLPDDVTVGFLVEVIVGAKLTVVPGFHSHLEEMKLLEGPLKDQISLSYMKKRKNFVGLEQRLPNDPTRFISIHCVLFPSEHLCTRLQAKHSN